MILYVGAAVALTILMVLVSMSLSHRTLLDPDVERDLTARLQNLSAASRGKWGRMSVSQMLRHLAAALRMSTGDLEVPPRHGLLRRFPIKQLIVFILPFPKDAPTSPALLSTESLDFEAERSTVRDLLCSFAKRNVAKWPDHPAFGALSRDEWGILVWKHVDHHLRQFGV